jgi:hypothetical protein
VIAFFGTHTVDDAVGTLDLGSKYGTHAFS